jgi:hypothetical protein
MPELHLVDGASVIALDDATARTKAQRALRAKTARCGD